MSSKFSKKNVDYNTREKLITGVICFLIFGLLAFFYAKYLPVEGSLMILVVPYLAGAISGTLVGWLGYSYPKVIHLTVFALPLMFVGS
jgi:hypothetical protein